jgi:hypothetical protein
MDEQNETRIAVDQVVPKVTDLGGYSLRRRDLNFLLINAGELAAWRARQKPLGINQFQFNGLVADLKEALVADGIELDTVDIRLKGSSAEFFSGPHKRMPTDRNDIIDLFREMRGRTPSDWEIDDSEDRLCAQWITDGDWPSQRPFDSMHRLNVSREPSDIDLQISSDAVAGRCEAILRSLGQPVTDARFKHPVYNFLRKDLVEEALPRVYLFTRRVADAVGRAVSVAAFPSDGPPDVSAAFPDLSAHHRPGDWIIKPAVAAESAA